jgi:hypothetical protein
MSGSERYAYTPAQERQYDALDMQGFTPDQIRIMLGVTASAMVYPPEARLTPTDHKPARPKAASGPQFGDSGRIETPNGRPIEDDGLRPSEEEQARTHHYTQHWREVGRKAIENGTHETTE